ncbi:MAG: response regulator transcription factor [Phycisphaerae bacterium]|nr:response regulator transcription factor [Phycisphaerae bacterium]
MRVLIVEDEPRLARNIARMLREDAGYAVDVSGDGEDGLHMAITNPYDLIVLDLLLPKLDGLTLLQRLRADGKQTPVLILTSLGQTQDVVAGLNAGSDDYLTKPFEAAEFLARAKALVRRSYGTGDSTLRVADLAIDTKARQVTRSKHRLTLTPMEYRLLEYLAMRKNQVVSKTDILEHLYEFNWERFSNVVEVYISSLRRKIDADASGKTPKLIVTVRGMGYMLQEPEEK